MKKIFFLLPALFILAVSCNNKKEKDDTGKGDTEKTSSKKNSLLGKWKPVMDEEAKDASIEFMAGGKYISFDAEEKEEGTYTYDEETKELTINSDEEGPTTFTITLEADKMTWTSGGSTLTLNRVN